MLWAGQSGCGLVLCYLGKTSTLLEKSYQMRDAQSLSSDIFHPSHLSSWTSG